jgi:tetratricopeptide (TPR) repeat protein
MTTWLGVSIVYEHYEPEERIFVDREEYLSWMDDALERCKEKSVVLHLSGIGGIGKSSLLDYWDNTIEASIRLDCSQYTGIYDRLNVIAKEAVLLGVRLQRFDVLWHIRKRFVEGVEPAKEEGREWAKEVLMAIPFIGSLTSIGSAIAAVSKKVVPSLREKYGEVGEWLQSRLGKNYLERFLEVLWKEPRHAEFLYIDALLEDLNCRKSIETPILILIDHFEVVDSEQPQWRYRGKKLTETDLWYVFLSSIRNGIGVVASRHPVPNKMSTEIEIEAAELTELDEESCRDLLKKNCISSGTVQDTIIGVSGGNPFVLNAICDILEIADVSTSDIEDLQADTLKEVRLKTWRKLFSQAEQFQDPLNRAGLVPYFDRRVMDIIYPSFTSNQWDRMLKLSFVRAREDGTFALHDLARDLIQVELGQRLKTLASEIQKFLEEASKNESDHALLGLAVSVQALAQPRDVLIRIQDIWLDFSWKSAYADALTFLDAIDIESEQGQALVELGKGWHLTYLNRIADGEHANLDALEVFKRLAESDPKEYDRYVAIALWHLGICLSRTGRSTKAEEVYRDALKIIRQVDSNPPSHLPAGRTKYELSAILLWFGGVLTVSNKLEEAEEVHNESLSLVDEWFETAEDVNQSHYNRVISLTLSAYAQLLNWLGKYSEAEKLCRRALENPIELLNRENSLNQLGTVLMSTGRLAEAEEVFQEQLQVAHQLDERQPEYAAQFSALLNLSMLQKLQCRYTEAEKTAMEAHDFITRFAERAPEVYSIQVAFILRRLGILFGDTGKHSEAEKVYNEALKIQRELLPKSQERYGRHFVLSGIDFGVLLRKMDRMSDAADLYLEALKIGKPLSEKSPGFFRGFIADILNNLGVVHIYSDQGTEAEATLQEALILRTQLANTFREGWRQVYRLGSTFNNLGILYCETDRTPQAKDAFDESLRLRREVAKKAPDLCLPGLILTLTNLGHHHRLTGNMEEAEEAYEEAIEAGEVLLSKAPEVFRQDMIRALSNCFILVSKYLKNEKVAQEIMKRLKELGIEEVAKEEEWAIEDLESL